MKNAKWEALPGGAGLNQRGTGSNAFEFTTFRTGIDSRFRIFDQILLCSGVNNTMEDKSISHSIPAGQLDIGLMMFSASNFFLAS